MAADKLNSARKYVVSKTLVKADWENSTLITGDAVKEIIELKNKTDLKFKSMEVATLSRRF